MAANYQHSIPTPPFSPQNQQPSVEQTEDPLKSTMNLLDSLVAFYQHERMWVYRTRAVLENAFDDPPQMSSSGYSDQSHDGQSFAHPMPSPSTSSSISSVRLMQSEMSERAPQASGHQPTRWMRRKKGFKLRLEGLSAKNRRTLSMQPQQQESLEPREQILEKFEKMMEARMESCERVNKLVRNANRANLHNR